RPHRLRHRVEPFRAGQGDGHDLVADQAADLVLRHCGRGSLGRPSTRSPMTLRTISDVPPPMECDRERSRNCWGLTYWLTYSVRLASYPLGYSIPSGPMSSIITAAVPWLTLVLSSFIAGASPAAAGVPATDAACSCMSRSASASSQHWTSASALIARSES